MLFPGFAHLGLLVGLLAGTLPPLIFWLARRRAAPRPFAALHVLRGAGGRAALVEALRVACALTLRCLLAITLAIALARPLAPTPQGAPAVAAGPPTVQLLPPFDIVADGQALRRQVVLQLRNAAGPSHPAVRLQLWVDGTLRQHGSVAVPAGATATYAFSHQFAAAGRHLIKGCSNVAPADGAWDCHEQSVVLPGPLHVVLIDGDRRHDEAGAATYAAAALREVPADEAPLLLTTLLPQAVDPNTLAAADVVLMCNVGELGPLAHGALRALLARGGGLLVSLGDQVQFERANAAWSDLLAFTLRDQETVCDAAAGVPPVGLEVVEPQHPAWRDLDAGWAKGLRHSKTCRYFNVESGSHRAARTLLRFDNGAPALLEALPQAAHGAAPRLLLLTTSWQRQDTDLPLRSAFVPLLQRLVRYLGEPKETSGAASAAAAVVPPPRSRQRPPTQPQPNRYAGLLLGVVGLLAVESLIVARRRR